MKKTILVILVLVLVQSSVSLSQEGWTRKADMPTARHSFAASVVNGKIYAIGGRAGGPISTVEEYDPATNTWTRKADMPTRRYNAATCVVNGKIYAIGGHDGTEVTRTVEEYDPATDIWTKKADIPLAVARSCAGVVNGKIYVILTEVQTYDPATDTWSVGAKTPTPRIPSVSVVDSKIYVIGGAGWDPPWAPFSIVEEYDPVTNTWTRKADIPTPRHYLSTCAVNGIIYTVGGRLHDNNNPVTTVEAYIPETDTWMDVPDMQVPRYSVATCTLQGDIYAIGGNPRNGVVEVYSAAPWGFASNPSPANGNLHVDQWVNLNWTPGDFATSHDVYLSEDFEDVNTGAIEAYRGNKAESLLIAGFAGFPYPDGLFPGTTYYWRIDEINDLHPESPWRGDVWSFFIPPTKAYDPTPADGAQYIDLNVTLGWTTGLDAKLHTVYFGDSFDGVDSATGGIQQTATTYTPGPLEPAKTYYWRIDELGGAQANETQKGDVWSFMTAGFVVDDFESYNDINTPDPESNIIFDNWKDGFGTADNGAIVGYYYPPYTEQTIVNSGSQSMPFHYDNNLKYSEAVLTLASRRDWTKDGVGVLSLWFRGYPASLGSFTEGTDGTFIINGEGARIGWKSDKCYFSYKTLSGPGSIVAKVDSIEGILDSARVGVMIRETLDPDSLSTCAYIFAGGGVEFHQRESKGSSGINTYQLGISAPHWLKLERDSFGTFRAFHSADGFNWQPFENSAPASIPMRSDIYIGLAVASYIGSHTCEVVFSNVTITGAVSSEWISQDIGLSTNYAESLYVAIANSGGENAVVYYDDPAATNIDTWTEWNIDLSKFSNQGVDISDVDTIAIGFGDRNNPHPGGKGKMYFDDIRLCK
ncbi:MAG: Kelch repeat-containing protein [Planctomycetota bacterium]